jgi:hypothetical protein
MTLTPTERELARAERERYQTFTMTPDELDLEIARWDVQITTYKVMLAERDYSLWDETTLRNGLAFARHRIDELTRQLNRLLRGGTRRPRQVFKADFDRARYVDLVGLAETLLATPAVATGNGRYRIRCPFHDDTRPSLVIYPPGQGWWCPVCHQGGQDAASFCAEFFQCSQLEGLAWVEQLGEGMREIA